MDISGSPTGLYRLVDGPIWNSESPRYPKEKRRHTARRNTIHAINTSGCQPSSWLLISWIPHIAVAALIRASQRA
jgi:hypothetical protein